MISVSRCIFMLLLFLFHGNAPLAAAPLEPEHSISEPTEAPLVVFNRTVFIFRGPLLGLPPEKRAERAATALRELLRSDRPHAVSIKHNPAGQLIMVGDTLAFIVTKGDLDPLKEDSLEDAAKRAAEDLQKVIEETLEARSFDSLLRSVIQSGIATAILAALLWIMAAIRKWISVKLIEIAARKADALKVGDTNLIERKHVILSLIHI